MGFKYFGSIIIVYHKLPLTFIKIICYCCCSQATFSCRPTKLVYKCPCHYSFFTKYLFIKHVHAALINRGNYSAIAASCIYLPVRSRSRSWTLHDLKFYIIFKILTFSMDVQIR